MRTKIMVVGGVMVCVMALDCAAHRHGCACDAAAASAASTTAKVTRAGAPLRQQAQRVSLRAVLDHPDDYKGKLVRLQGKIDQVCPMRGCWLLLDDAGARARVTFKDYGFFVPTDSAGKQVRMDARVVKQTISEERAMHLQSETEGGNQEAVRGPQHIVALVATGVEISPSP